MKQTLPFILSIFLFNENCFSQGFEKVYPFADTTQGVWVQKIKQTADSGFIMMGSAWTDERTYFLIRTNQTGDTLWTRAFFEDDTVSYAYYDLELAFDGGYVMLGAEENNERSLLFRKIDVSGNTIWEFTDSTNWEPFGKDIALADDSVYLLLSYAGGNYVIHVDYQGNEIKRDNIGAATDSPHKIVSLQNNEYIIADVEESFSEQSLKIAHFGSNGDSLYTKTIWSVPNNEYFLLSDFRKTSDGGYVFLLRYDDNATYPWNVLIKSNSSGDTLWTCQLTFENEYLDQTGEVIEKNGEYYVCATIDYHLSFVKVDNSGNLAWRRFFDGKDDFDAYGSTLTSTYDGGFALCGSQSSSIALTGYLVKTDLNGCAGISYNDDFKFICNGDSVLINGQYIKQPGVYKDTTDDFGCTVISDITLEVYNCTFDPTDSTYYMDCSTCTVCTNCSYEYLGTTVEDEFCETVSDLNYIIQYYADSFGIIFDCEYNFIIVSGIESARESSSLHLYPNPAEDYFYFSINASPGSSFQIELYDITGRLSEQWKTISASRGIKSRHHEPGIYFLVITDLNSGKSSAKKIVLK